MFLVGVFALPFWATVSGLFGAALVCSENHERREQKQEHCFKVIIVRFARPAFLKL